MNLELLLTPFIFLRVEARKPRFQAALRSINAAVAGILPAVLYAPVWTAAIKGPQLVKQEIRQQPQIQKTHNAADNQEGCFKSKIVGVLAHDGGRRS